MGKSNEQPTPKGQPTDKPQKDQGAPESDQNGAAAADQPGVQNDPSGEPGKGDTPELSGRGRTPTSDPENPVA